MVAHWAQFTGRLVQGLALVAVDIRLQQIADGCDGQSAFATASGLCTHPVIHKNHKCWHTAVPLVLRCGDHAECVALCACGIPKDMGDKIRIGGAHKWAEMLHHPCILGYPQRHGGQNQNWWGPQVGGNATSPLHSRISPKTGGTKSKLVGPTSGRKCYITPAFSDIPKDMGDRIRIGCLTPALWEAHKWAEMLHHPCILGYPQRHGGQNQNWWGPQVGGNATSPLHSRISPKTWGTKSELDA